MSCGLSDDLTAPRLSRALKKTFLSLRNRNFRLYFTGQLISNTGNWLTNVALVLLVLKITGSGIAVGILAACQWGPILLLSAWAGAIADRSDKRRMLLLAFVPGVVFAVPAVFLLGMASVLYLTATTAIVQVEAKPEMHGRVLALQIVLMGGAP